MQIRYSCIIFYCCHVNVLLRFLFFPRSSRASNEHRGSGSEAESDEENEEGDYTVYECPGLAAVGIPECYFVVKSFFYMFCKSQFSCFFFLNFLCF